MMRLLSSILGVAGVAAALVAALIVGESTWLGLFASDSQVAEYHFGAKSMVAHGGLAYSSFARYVTSGILEGVALAIVAAACLFFSVKIWRMPSKPVPLARARGARR